MLLLDLSPVSSFADYFVIATCVNPRHMQAVADEIEKVMHQGGQAVLHREGLPDSGWMLLDCGDIIVHLFTDQTRQHYGLEQLWRAAPVVLHIQ